MALPEGIYDRLLDREVKELLENHPDLRSVLKKIDAAESPVRFAAFLGKVIEEALHQTESLEQRRNLCNSILEHLSKAGEFETLDARKLERSENGEILTEITPSHFADVHFPRPVTPIWESSLFTGATSDPRLDHELIQEMHSADRIDFLVSFIRWSGLRLLLPALEAAEKRCTPVRVITTSYMGASEARAVERLVVRQFRFEGYSDFNFTLESSQVKCQSVLRHSRLRHSSAAAH